MKRIDELVKDVAMQFENASQPLNEHWQEQKNVTLNEMTCVTATCALVLGSFVALKESDRSAFIAKGQVARYGKRQNS